MASAEQKQQQTAVVTEISGRARVCRARVPVGEVYVVAYDEDEANQAFVDVIFHCPRSRLAWCCGVDCCQVSTFIIIVSILLPLSIHLSVPSMYQG